MYYPTVEVRSIFQSLALAGNVLTRMTLMMAQVAVTELVVKESRTILATSWNKFDEG